MLYVGIDWADEHHDVCFTDDAATTLAQFQIAHHTEGFTALHTQIAQHQADPAAVLVALETTRGRFVYDLLCQGDHIYAIQPKAVKRYTDRHVLSAAQDDRLDALALAHRLRTERHRFKPLGPPPEPYRRLERRGLDVRQRIDDKTRLSNHITSCLKAYSPQAVGWFRDVASPIAVACLPTFPDPDTVRQTDQSAFAACFRAPCSTPPPRVDTRYARTHTPAPEADPVVVGGGKRCLVARVEQ
jgi:transposase